MGFGAFCKDAAAAWLAPALCCRVPTAASHAHSSQAGCAKGWCLLAGASVTNVLLSAGCLLFVQFTQVMCSYLCKID